MIVGAQFFRQNTWFLKNNRALSKFLCGILHFLISITKLSEKNSPFKLILYFICLVSQVSGAPGA